MRVQSRVGGAVLGLTFLLGFLHNASTFVNQLAMTNDLPFVYESIGTSVVLYAYVVAFLTFLCEPVLAVYLGYRTQRDGRADGLWSLVETVAVAGPVGFAVGRALLFAVLPASVVPVAVPSFEFLLVVLIPGVAVTIQFVVAVVAGTALAHFEAGPRTDRQNTTAEAQA
jgi:uncharacterized membrane protein YhaH (DUF805 family)